MPMILRGENLTEHEHDIWKSVFEDAKKEGINEPGAVASAAVIKYRTRRAGQLRRKKHNDLKGIKQPRKVKKKKPMKSYEQRREEAQRVIRNTK